MVVVVVCGGGWWKQWWWWRCVAADPSYLSQPALEPTAAPPLHHYSTTIHLHKYHTLLHSNSLSFNQLHCTAFYIFLYTGHLPIYSYAGINAYSQPTAKVVVANVTAMFSLVYVCMVHSGGGNDRQEKVELSFDQQPAPKCYHPPFLGGKDNSLPLKVTQV